MPKPACLAALYCYGPGGGAHRAILEAVATGHAWQILEAYHDTAPARPELKRLQSAVMAAKLEAVMVHDLAELGNGVLELIETAAWLEAQGVHLYSINPPLDTGSPAGRKPMELILYLAGYQASKRQERQRLSRPAKPPGGARKKPAGR